MPQTSNFRLPRGHRFFTKKGSYGYGVKSWWGSPRVLLGANGVPLGPKKLIKNREKLPWSKIRIFDYGFFAKNGSYGNGVKLRWGSPKVRLGANGVPSGPNPMVKAIKITMPQISNFPLPRGHGFFAVIDFSQKMEVTVMAPNHGGDPLGSILGSIGSHWVQKMGKTVKNNHALKFEFSTTPRSLIFRKKWKLRLWRKLRWWAPRVHLGANGVPLYPKNGSKL